MNTIEIICSIIGAVAVVLGGMWFLLKRAMKHGVNTNRLDTVESKINALPCDQHSTNFANSEKGMAVVQTELCHHAQQVIEYQTTSKTITDDLLNIKLDIREIKTALYSKSKKMSAALTQKLSPRKLTPLGSEIYKDCGGDKFYRTNKNYFLDLLEQVEPKTMLDVETAAQMVLIEHLNEPIFIHLKNWVYNAPSRKLENGDILDITINDICMLMSIELRDDYIELHRNTFLADQSDELQK